MKTDWSHHWKASTQPRKQRKYQYNASLHIIRKMLASPLTKELRKKYATRNTPIVKGDTVMILRGQFRGKTGKVLRVFTRMRRIHIDGITQLKKDGTKIPYALHPSKVRITELNLEDKRRLPTPEKK